MTAQRNATRAHRKAGLVHFIVTLPIAERDQIARLGYEAIAGDDVRAAGEALRIFISDTVACLDTEQR